MNNRTCQEDYDMRSAGAGLEIIRKFLTVIVIILHKFARDTDTRRFFGFFISKNPNYLRPLCLKPVSVDQKFLKESRNNLELKICPIIL